MARSFHLDQSIKSWSLYGSIRELERFYKTDLDPYVQDGEPDGGRVRYFEEGIRFEKTPMVFEWD